MAFMQPDIQPGDWLEVETTSGESCTIPADLADTSRMTAGTIYDADAPEAPDVSDYVEGTPATLTLLVGRYGARLSAPGYLDCTEWSVFETEAEAREYLRDTYDVCPECGNDLDTETCPDCEVGADFLMQCKRCGFAEHEGNFETTDTSGERLCPKCHSAECYTK